MPTYRKVQCVAYVIQPGSTLDPVYLGKASADLDIQKRCEIMRAAVAVAHRRVEELKPPPPANLFARLARNIGNVDRVLKIFMAPEFFFRGEDGAYPIEMVEKILPAMAKETRKSKYKDWLFVFGTAIGYQNPQETITKAVESTPKEGKTLAVVDGVSKDPKDWLAHEYAKTSVTKVKKTAVNRYQLTLDTRERFTNMQRVTFVHGRDADRTPSHNILTCDWEGADGPTRITVQSTKPIERKWTAEIRGFANVCKVISVEPYVFEVDSVRRLEHDQQVEVTLTTAYRVRPGYSVKFKRQHDDSVTESYSVLSSTSEGGHAAFTIRYPGQERHGECPTCHCNSFQALEHSPEICINCLHTHTLDSIRKGWRVDAEYRGLLLDRNQPVGVGHFITLEPAGGAEEHSEVFNMALVQRGGPPADEKRPLLVYKEKYSEVDFIDGPAPLPIAGPAPLPIAGPAPIAKKYYKIGGRDAVLDNTEGSATRTSEEHGRSGLGGGSVFTVENCTIGLEICLDHAKGRLDNYYGGPGGAGKQKPQIHLIPSMGMRIGWGPVCCRPDGIIFNVDGGYGAVVRKYDGKYSCDLHPSANKSAAGERCPQCMEYRCNNCGSFSHTLDGRPNHPCPNCGSNSLIKYFKCDNFDTCRGWNAVAGDCPSCSTPAERVPLKEFDALLLQIGSEVAPYPGPRLVDVPGWDISGDDQTDYFVGKGSITVYPAKDIPGA